MKFVTVQPDTPYFHWQLMVLHNNMKQQGMFEDSITVIGYDESPSDWAQKYKEQFPKQVYLIQDARTNYARTYIPSIRAHLLSKLCSCVLKGHNWMYHDSDVLFINKVDWDGLVMDTSKVYVSDTVGYIGSSYIRSKGEELFKSMCSIVGIDPQVVINNEIKSGGAQYIFGRDIKLGRQFWQKVEADSIELFALMNDTAHIYCPEHPIQSWTSDMWALLWNIWKLEYDTEIISELNFSWPHHPIETISQCNIFHNAGVSGTEPDLFFKGAFTTIAPFNSDFTHIDKTKCSYRYVQEIERIASIYQ